MINRITKMFSAGALASVLIAAGTLPAPAQTNSAAANKLAEILGDPVVAKGKGVEVKRSQIDEVIISYKASMAANGQAVPPQQLRILERRLLDELIARGLLLGKATEADKLKGKAELETALKKLKTDAKLTDAEFDEKLATQLKTQNMSREQWNQKQLDQAVFLAVLERELKVNITDDVVKKFYDEHPAQFEEPERVRVAHILIGTKDPADTAPDPSMRRDLPEPQKQVKRKQIDELLKRARAGEDFTKLAKENSEDPGVKENNGEYTLARGDQFVPEFKAAAFSLGSNQVSEVVTTVFGYHILKLMEKLPAQKLELAKVSDRLKQGLKQQEIVKLMPDYLEKVQKDAGVEILDETLKAVDLNALMPPKVASPDATGAKPAPK